MYFSEEALVTMQAELASVPGKQRTLQELFLRRTYHEARAEEFAHHGYLRRIKTLARCIEKVFALIPPDQMAPPETEIRQDAEIYIQASVFSVFAAADNLAWIWATEKAITRPDGSPLPETWVGLRSTNTAVRNAMPAPLRDYLVSLDHGLMCLITSGMP